VKQIALAVVVMLAIFPCISGAEEALPVLKVETLATPARTSRMWVTALSPNPRGGWNFIAEFMNYKYTTGWKFVRRQTPDGKHEYVTFRDTRGRPDAEWVIVDLDKGTSRVIDLPGFHGGRAVRAGNGRIFFPVDFFQIWYYEPAEETIRILGQLAEWKPYTNDRGIYRFMLGPDGFVYGTTQAHGGTTSLVRINPDTLEFKLYHGVGTGKRKTRLTYGYYLGLDPPWAYVAVGQSEWELFAVNVETGEKRCLAERSGKGARITVSQGEEAVGVELLGPYAPDEAPPGGKLPRSEGHVYYMKSGKKERHWCSDGRLFPAVRNADGSLPFTPLNGKAYRKIQWRHTRPSPAGTPPEIDRSRLAIGRNGGAEVRWRPERGRGEWRSARFAIKHAEPVPIECLIALPDGSLFGGVKQYQGFFRYYPETTKLEYFGKHGPSGAALALMDGKVFLCGYPNTNLSAYDPSRPWTSTGKTQRDKDPGKNPAFIGYWGQGRTEAHYCRFLIAGGNGRLYIGGKRERWATGTGIGYYEPAGGAKVGLPKDMTDLSPRGMVLLPGLKRIVVSGKVGRDKENKETGAAEAQLRVYDLDLKEMERLTVRPGLRSTGRLYRAGRPGCIIGQIETQDVRALYLYDVGRKKLLNWADLDAPLGSRIIERQTDKSRWVVKNATLCRLNPETLALSPVARLEPTISGHRLWIGNDLYGANAGELVHVRVAKQPR